MNQQSQATEQGLQIRLHHDQHVQGIKVIRGMEENREKDWHGGVKKGVVVSMEVEIWELGVWVVSA